MCAWSHSQFTLLLQYYIAHKTLKRTFSCNHGFFDKLGILIYFVWRNETHSYHRVDEYAYYWILLNSDRIEDLHSGAKCLPRVKNSWKPGKSSKFWAILPTQETFTSKSIWFSKSPILKKKICENFMNWSLD